MLLRVLLRVRVCACVGVMEVCSGTGLSFSIIAVINGLNETQLGRWGGAKGGMISHPARLK